jgi:hypothetical protein
MKIKLVIIDSIKTQSVPGIKYYIDTKSTRHISHWRYSPKECRRVIESNFDLNVFAKAK